MEGALLHSPPPTAPTLTPNTPNTEERPPNLEQILAPGADIDADTTDISFETLDTGSTSGPPQAGIWSKVHSGLTHFFYTTSSAFRSPSSDPTTLLSRLTSPMHPTGPITFLAAHTYPSFTDPAFLDDFRSRPWMTYRSGFEGIEGTAFTSDVGWGCMLRSGQMLLSGVLLRHLLGKDWRLSQTTTDSTTSHTHARIISMFADTPLAPFSLHNIALLGARKFGKSVGEWFGPSTISQCLKELVEQTPNLNLTVHIATDNTLYTSSVIRQCTSAGDDTTGDWTPVLILVPLMLGVRETNPVYFAGLKACFGIEACVGVAGGRPNSSLFFVGTAGDNVLYLDPHTVRPAVSLPDPTDEDLATYTPPQIRTISLTSLDPSLVLGFYCPTPQSFTAFTSACLGSQVSSGGTPLFAIMEKEPEFRDRGADVDVLGDDDDF
ncbi:uncharacterized protein EV422DRAFT_571102 [Fimicolochytrium jonesii]|uniref:uncharacterized protein n=1 Tax=Fimicolochytrium jonesii TaxID=1396493 RepID=UPI0022FE5487|nr:uncharacterized protein EV422DRAFT_571102 [Fimicolochytrium jonesii]KAI8817017.1 hypothetical protein EV422DRAFT_571102 [Fimicolochytrium jonesii]